MTDKPHQTTSARWSSAWVFVLAAAGSAIGLGNIWKFPYIVGENGGGAFVLVYLLCILLIGLPVMMGEVLIGRRARLTPVTAFADLARRSGASALWSGAGWMMLLSALLVMSFYVVIAGWVLAYVFKAASGVFAGADPAAIEMMFRNFTGDAGQLFFWSGVLFAAAYLVVRAGVEKGLERAIILLMPIMIVVLLIMVGYAATTGHFMEGVRFLFLPDFSRLTAGGVLIALGHAFFTLSLANGIMLVYGAYLPADASIPKSVFWVAGADTLIALIAGLAIFPIVFAYGLEPGQGPGLIFETMPLAFGQMPGGLWVGSLFFIMMVLAAFATMISVLEVLVAHVTERYGWTRSRATAVAVGLLWLLSVGTVLSFNMGAEWTLAGQTFFELVDHLTTNILLPAGGILVAVFAGRVLKPRASSDELGTDPGSVGYRLWWFAVKWVSPLLIALVFLHALGLFPQSH